MFCNVFLVVSIICKPLIGYGQLKGGVGSRKYRYPFVGMYRCSVIQIRANVNALDPQLCKPVAQKGGKSDAESMRGDLRVASPDMLGSLVPAFP